MVPVEPSPNWSECLVGFLVDVPNQPPKRFYMTWLHHSPPLRQGENLMFFFFLGGGASHCFAIFFFRMSLLPKRSSWASEGTQDPEVRARGRPSAKGGQAVPLVEGFLCFPFPQDQCITYHKNHPIFEGWSRDRYGMLLIIFRRSVWVLGELYVYYIYIYILYDYLHSCMPSP